MRNVACDQIFGHAFAEKTPVIAFAIAGPFGRIVAKSEGICGKGRCWCKQDYGQYKGAKHQVYLFYAPFWGKHITNQSPSGILAQFSHMFEGRKG